MVACEDVAGDDTVLLEEAVRVSVLVDEGVDENVRPCEAVPETDADALSLEVPVIVTVAAWDAVRLCDIVAVWLAVLLWVAVILWVAVMLWVAVTA